MEYAPTVYYGRGRIHFLDYHIVVFVQNHSFEQINYFHENAANHQIQ